MTNQESILRRAENTTTLVAYFPFPLKEEDFISVKNWLKGGFSEVSIGAHKDSSQIMLVTVMSCHVTSVKDSMRLEDDVLFFKNNEIQYDEDGNYTNFE